MALPCRFYPIFGFGFAFLCCSKAWGAEPEIKSELVRQGEAVPHNNRQSRLSKHQAQNLSFYQPRFTIRGMPHPQPNEAAPYYSKYIDLIPGDDILGRLTSQLQDVNAFLATISDEQSLHSYSPGKWTIRQVVNHVNDGERVFLGRALWFARGFQDALPSFDQDICVAAAGANEMSWSGLREEFEYVRKSTISFFQNLSADAWMRRGVASDNPFTVNALAYIIAGHVAHHRNVLAERYL
jgi:uncharacterized damage-inducible protein DinB